MLKKFTVLFVLLCALYGCGGEDTAVNTTPLPPDPPVPPLPRVVSFLVSGNRDAAGGSVSLFQVDPDTGSLAQVSEIATGGPVNKVSAYPDRPFVYAAVNDQPLVDGFRIDPATGTLTRLAGFPIPSSNDSSVLFDRTGTFLYVLGNTDIDAFRADPDSGALTHVTGFPMPVPGMLEAKVGVFNGDNSLLLVSDETTNQIFAFRFNSGSGALQLASQTPTAAGPAGLAFDPLDQFLYVAGSSGTLQSFTVSPDGVLTPVPGGQATYAPAGARSFELASIANLIYVGDAVTSTLSAFQADVNGALTPVPGFPVAGGAAVLRYPFPLLNGFLYSSDTFNERIFGYRSDLGGNLLPVPGSPFREDGDPASLTPVVLSF